ncbi:MULTISPECIES: peptide deformylase [Virgibacillus]|uniref:Peptide deformylase n=2 Tax=Virgibacillus TaxID=84406 RepID=A0A024QCN5_9BACI|nr:MULTISPECIES: peptide deformylase [Virgibacillus]EQB36567.1 peptide deformylase [Virgibacillus sp. CM-4]MYL42399.1 peptide deformylase [Virgibacillus massiliensis]GGJ42882.1 peptide deformylase 2 [Virgibacillus kapii]CDQ40264.1 Peptide deformylase 2 [Virgibacillus massiliensis]
MITMKDIVREGHPSLTEVADEVDIPLNESDKQLIEDMLMFLKNSQDEEIAEKYQLRAGVGLAAPQLGLNKRLVAVHFEDPNGKHYSYGLVNPKIISHSVEKSYLSTGEGCLSVDRPVEGYVPRHARVTVKAFDKEGNPLKLRLKGYAAVVFQHEIDHLNGIMFYDHINQEQPFAVPENATPVE